MLTDQRLMLMQLSLNDVVTTEVGISQFLDRVNWWLCTYVMFDHFHHLVNVLLQY